jgi:hypothetical protein
MEKRLKAKEEALNKWENDVDDRERVLNDWEKQF